MKKLMFAVAAIAAGAAVADVTSANVVGYAGKDTGENYNYYVPQFLAIGNNTINIQSISLNDGGLGLVGWGDAMQIVGPLGNSEASYFYWDKSMDPTLTVTSDQYWGDEGFSPVAVSFDKGCGVAIDNPNAYDFQIQNAGEVMVGEVTVPANINYTWTGNPFSAQINIQSISLDDGGLGLVGWGDAMQVVGPLGNASESYFYWDKSMDPTLTVTADRYWGDEGFSPVSRNFVSGESFAIDNPNGYEFNIVIMCPYSL